MVRDLVRAQRGLGCIPIKTPKMAKKIIKVIILTRLETFPIAKRVMAAMAVRRKKRYFGVSMN
jgi:hypothetical protein